MPRIDRDLHDLSSGRKLSKFVPVFEHHPKFYTHLTHFCVMFELSLEQLNPKLGNPPKQSLLDPQIFVSLLWEGHEGHNWPQL